MSREHMPSVTEQGTGRHRLREQRMMMMDDEPWVTQRSPGTEAHRPSPAVSAFALVWTGCSHPLAQGM